MADLKVGADSGLRVVNRGSWDASAAKEHIFSWAGWPDNPEPSKAKKAFFIYDAGNAENKGAYSDPFADVVNGELVAIDAGIRAAASRLPQTDAPKDVIDRAVAIKDKYMKKINPDENKSKSEVEDNNLEFIITKAALGKDGVMRWAATVSKFAADEQKDEVTREFYEDAINRVEKGEFPMPALVVSHYDDPRVEAIGQPVPEIFKAGATTAMYIDRNQPKAKGVFSDTPLGKAVFEAVRNDIAGDMPIEERARISMAFRPDPNGIEKSESGVVKYKSGHIRHFAVTRVPIVKETNIVVEKSDVRKTKYQDASTIVGDDLATNLDREYKSLTKSKSETSDVPVLVEKADNSDNKSDFDMGKCITEAMGAGKPRKQAIAYCLNVQSEKKKANTAADDNTREQPNLMDLFSHDDCVQEYVAKGWSEAAAKAFCDAQAIKMSKMPMAQMSMEGMANMGTMNNQKADVEIDKSTQAAPEKADLDTLMDKVITDETIQVVKSGSDTASTADEAKSKKTKKAVNPDQTASDAEEASESDTEAALEASGNMPEGTSEDLQNTEGKGKSQKKKSEVVDADVNVTSEIVPVSKDRVAELTAMYKAALENTTMDRTTKVQAINMVLKELGELAQEGIKTVSPSSQDQATMLKAALEEVVGPLIDQIKELKEENIRYKSLAKGGFDRVVGIEKPQPKGLIPQTVQKSNTKDNGGALTSDQIAQYSVKLG